MNIQKSLNIALAQREMLKKDFAEKLGVSPARLRAMATQKRFDYKTIATIAGGLDMKISEFIALGEE